MEHSSALRDQRISFDGWRKANRILIVEDDRSSLMFLEQQVRGLGYDVVGVGDGEAACRVLEDDPERADVIVLDHMLPGMQGLDVVRRLRSDVDLRAKPIVMLTGCDDACQVKEGVDAGVFYYLTKPVEANVLQSIMAAAMRRAELNQFLRREVRLRRRGMSCAKSAQFEIKSLSEANDVAALISGSFPEPDRAILGINELLTNAIEHGNLEIGFERKAELLESNELHAEIERRLNLPEYRERTVQVAVMQKEAGTYLVVTDEGPGFDPAPFLTLDPSRARQKNGRGIAQVRTSSFDKLCYNRKGNKVVAFAKGDGRIEW